MGTMYKIFFIMILSGGFIFARTGKNNPRMIEKKKVKSDYYCVKNNSEDFSNDQLDRKRSHKRRRKIRKPVKGLR